MVSFADASRSAIAKIARSVADRLLFQAHPPRIIVRKPGDAAPCNYRQPVRLIDGMPAAPEPCCLATHWSEATHPKDAVAETKIDGVRALYVDVSIVSREALPLDCALHCLPALHELEKCYGQPMVFDGEYQEPGGLQPTLAAMRCGMGCGTFWIFDAVPYAEWRVNRFTERRKNRRFTLAQHLATLNMEFVALVGCVEVPTPTDALAVAQRAWANGGEGIVVKSDRDLYFRGRGKVWQKLKQKQTFDGVIVDALIKDGRCNAIMVKMPADSPSPGKVVRIGSNIPEELREALAVASGDFIGWIAEIGFNDTTDTGNLRGGYFIRMRDDKGEDHAA